jgi:hypothetical protein
VNFGLSDTSLMLIQESVSLKISGVLDTALELISSTAAAYSSDSPSVFVSSSKQFQRPMGCYPHCVENSTGIGAV